MRKNPKLAHGLSPGRKGKAEIDSLWEGIAVLVNGVPGAVKSPKEWKNAFNSLKSRARKSYRDKVQSYLDAGCQVPPPSQLNLNNVYAGVIEIVGTWQGNDGNVHPPMPHARPQVGQDAPLLVPQVVPRVHEGSDGECLAGAVEGPPSPSAELVHLDLLNIKEEMHDLSIHDLFDFNLGDVKDVPIEVLDESDDDLAVVFSNVNQAGAQKATRERNLTAGAVAPMQFNHRASEFIKQEAADSFTQEAADSKLEKNPMTPESSRSTTLFHTPPCGTGLTPARKRLQLSDRPAVEQEVAALQRDLEDSSLLRQLLQAIQTLTIALQRNH